MSEGSFDLPFLRDGTGAVARQRGRIITRAEFLAEIEELAALLPDQPYLINFCSDRYRFTVALAAAMLRRQVTLLPNSRDAAAAAAIREAYPALYVLTDDDQVEGNTCAGFAYPTRLGQGGSTRGTSHVPAFAADQIAAVLFTSGTTGKPTPSPRSWGRLVAGSVAAGAALGIDQYAGAAVVATVPHGHSYGLESAVMLPLQHGLLLTAERPFFPADVIAALDAEPRGVLVTTPVHLRALVEDTATTESASAVGASVRVGFVLSATAPLSPELAARAETRFNAPLFEIFGCSEAGQLATRRTTRDAAWRCLDGFRLRQDAAGTWASGPVEADVLLADAFELRKDVEFILLGRTADMVNIAGKRASLAYLTHELMAIDGVEDGIFLVPDDAVAGMPSRLAAIVAAPDRNSTAILNALRKRIDPAFLPRPLRVVDKLPRNALGKLTRAEVVHLLNMVPAKPCAPIVLHIPPDHPAGPGHFPGNPIVPGAVLLDAIMASLFPDGWTGEIEAAKFHHPVRPGDSVAVTHTTDDDNALRFEGRLACSRQLVLSGLLRSAFPSR